MTRGELIEHISRDHELTKAAAESIVKDVFSLMAGTLGCGGDVSIHDFGTFRVTERKARVGRNPQTGESIRIPASKTVKFRPWAALKELL